MYTPYGEHKGCQPGDVLGCLLNYQTLTVSFTLNGRNLGEAFKWPSFGTLYPAVCLGSPSTRVRVNFGQQPFRYAEAPSMVALPANMAPASRQAPAAPSETPSIAIVPTSASEAAVFNPFAIVAQQPQAAAVEPPSPVFDEANPRDPIAWLVSSKVVPGLTPAQAEAALVKHGGHMQPALMYLLRASAERILNAGPLSGYTAKNLMDLDLRPSFDDSRLAFALPSMKNEDYEFAEEDQHEHHHHHHHHHEPHGAQSMVMPFTGDHQESAVHNLLQVCRLMSWLLSLYVGPCCDDALLLF